MPQDANKPADVKKDVINDPVKVLNEFLRGALKVKPPQEAVPAQPAVAAVEEVVADPDNGVEGVAAVAAIPARDEIPARPGITVSVSVCRCMSALGALGTRYHGSRWG